MKIAIIAANGRSGTKVVHAAIAAGHDVVAGVRGSHSFTPDKHLVVQDCDATNFTEVKALLRGCDAVVSMIGHISGTHPEVQTVATKHCIAAMNQLGMRRIISLTGTGVRFDGDKPSLIDRLLTIGVGMVDPQRMSDGKQHAELLKASSLDWTLLRVLKLQNTPPRPYRLTTGGPAKLITSRDEVASAVITLLQDNSFVAKSPIISHQ